MNFKKVITIMMTSSVIATQAVTPVMACENPSEISNLDECKFDENGNPITPTEEEKNDEEQKEEVKNDENNSENVGDQGEVEVPDNNNNNNNSGETTPTNPANPTDPANPIEPEKPENPTDPSNPSDNDKDNNQDQNKNENDQDKTDENGNESKDDQTTDKVEDKNDGNVKENQNNEAKVEDNSNEVVNPEIKYDGYNSTMTSENEAYIVNHYSQDLDTEKFIAAIGESARIIAEKNDLYASVMIAQAVIESGHGTSELSEKPNFNLFGIKGAFKGNYINMPTNEDAGDGTLYTISSNFRKYNNYFESMTDYSNLISTEMKLYFYGATKECAKSPEEAANWLQGKYASSTNYAQSIMDIINTYDLTRYDEKEDKYISNVTGLNVKVSKDERVENRRFNMQDYAKLAAIATSKLGYDYVWGGESDEEGGYDCSGLVYYAYKKAFGIELPRTTYGMEKLGTEVSFDDLEMGDLLFFQSENGDTHHVAMYLGNGYYIQAPEEGDVVKITSMDEYMPTFAKRMIGFDAVDENGNVVTSNGAIKINKEQVKENEAKSDYEFNLKDLNE